MTVQDYFGNVMSKYKTAEIREEAAEKIIAYEGIFKLEWLATKLKIFSVVTYSPSIDLRSFESYSADCLKNAKKNKSGLPVGFQNGVVGYGVLVADKIPWDVADFAETRPKKHFAAFEFPVAVDLSAGKIHYYRGDIVWGMIYSDFLKRYAEDHFGL